MVLLALKIGPLYLNNSKIASSLTAVKNMSDLNNKSAREIRTSIEKNFDMNYVDHVTNDDITVIAMPGYVKVDVEYERVEPIVGNLSVLVQFHEGFESGNR